MPPKSKRSRRKISPGAKVIRNTDSASAGSGITEQAYKISSPNSDLKSAGVADTNSSAVLNEIKWIGIVTAIVFVVLALSYIFFR